MKTLINIISIFEQSFECQSMIMESCFISNAIKVDGINLLKV